MQKSQGGILNYPYIYCIICILLLVTSNKGFGQVGLNGPSSGLIGTSYSYTPNYNGLSSYAYNGSYSYTITGGVVTGTSNTTKSGTSTSVIGSTAINVTWTASTGSLFFTCSLGSITLNVTMSSALAPGTISPASQTINYGTAASVITGTVATGGAASPIYQYQWMSSPDAVTWGNISGATSVNYSPGILFSTKYFRRMVTETNSGTSGYSNSATITVYPQLSCTISPLTQSILSGTSAATLSSTITGGSGTYTYQWQSSPDNSVWTNVATTATFSPGVLTTTKYYKLIVTSNGASLTSSVATVTVSLLPTGTLSVTGTTPNGNGSVNTLTVAASGGNGTYTYAWYSSINGGSTYQVVSGASANAYTTGVITATTLFYVVVSSGGNSANSNIVTITIPSAPTITANALLLCNGAIGTLTATGGSGNYKWYNSSNTLLGTGASYATTIAGSYYAVSTTVYGISPASNSLVLTVNNTAVVPPITGNTILLEGSGEKLANTLPGGVWQSSNTFIARVDINGVVSADSVGSSTISYTVNNGCGAVSQQLGITILPFTIFSQELGRGLEDNPKISIIPLVQNTVQILEIKQDTLNASAHRIKNTIAFKIDEEATSFIPGDFSATVVVKIEYGHSPDAIYQIDSTSLIINYTKAAGAKYDAIKYLSFEDAEYTRVTVVRLVAPTTVNSVSFDTKTVLSLTNRLTLTRYYKLADNKKPIINNVVATPGVIPDGLNVYWIHPTASKNNYTQLEWTWLENEMSSNYISGSVFDTALLFKNGATRLDLPGASLLGNYTIPLLYNGVGKLFVRVRGISIMGSGSRSDGPWSGVQTFAFNGHNDNLNWQQTTTYAEEGKRKTVVNYYDGSLRSRQTVTKDNTTQTTVVAETMYDAQGRPAVQVLPSPNLNNLLGYVKNFNKYSSQSDNMNPLDYFDFTTTTLGKYATEPMRTDTGAGKYYSANNPQALIGFHKNIPNANGFPYTVTRYTPDATGRIMLQGGVGDSLQIGKSHATRYFYGTAAQEELNALFGTEAGYYTHYFKNMVQDANGQMSVSYVDMHGRTVATALAGEAPPSTHALPISDVTQYSNQAGKLMSRNLLDRGSNVIKENARESSNSILVPFKTLYNFNYNLGKQKLVLPKCSGGNVTYNCRFDVQISISDESGDTSAFVYNYLNIDTLNFQNSLLLPAGSYNVRKTLTINQESFTEFMRQYDSLTIGICRTRQFLTDSITSLDSTASGCNLSKPPLSCTSCLNSLGTYSTYKFNYADSLGITDTTLLSIEQRTDIRNQYLSDSSFCRAINISTSHSLEIIEQQMLADMVPYSGQYARDTGTVSMAKKFNIFATGGGSIYAQPFYKSPRNRNQLVDKYYDYFGGEDTTVTTSKLATMSVSDYELAYSGSWSKAMLPYHPEFNKLKYAQDNMQVSYNFIDSINSVVINAINPITLDPFFSVMSPAADKDSIIKYSTVSWKGGFSMWQLAYADAFGCKTMDTFALKACYAIMPKSINTIGVVVNTGSGNVTLSSAIQAQAWSMFKGFYTLVRNEMMSKYINLHAANNNPDTLYNRTLILQKFRLYFPYDNVQQAENSGMTAWYPNQAGVYPVVSLTDSVTKYASRCDGYINSWRQVLLACPALAAKDSATRESILNSITTRMIAVCKKGTDGANSLGASTISPAYAGAADTSFEQIVNAVFLSFSISRDQYCHPYGIESPKPYGKNPVLTQTFVANVDTCRCSQYTKLIGEVAAAGYSTSSLSSMNTYLKLTYNDTISPVLYQALLQCGQWYLYNCSSRVVDTFIYHLGVPIPTQMTITTCDTLYARPLSSPQNLPAFLNCGFSGINSSCFDCAYFKSLETSFIALFGKTPVFTGVITNDTTLAYNALFAKYVNFKTGLQKTWQEYAQRFAAAPCNIGGISGTNTSYKLCLDFTPVNDTTGLVALPSPCQQVRNNAGIKAALIYETIEQQLLASFKKAYLDSSFSVKEIFKVTDSVKEYHYTLYYYDQAGNLIKTVPPKGVNPIYRQTFSDSVDNARKTSAQLIPIHTLATRYSYNSLNQVNIQKTPDGKTSRFYYDRLGRLVISQNAIQKQQGNIYSYTQYDSLGRITEVGQLTGGTAMTDAVSKNEASLTSWLATAASSRTQITQTVYDTANTNLAGILNQKNLRNRVSFTQFKPLAANIFPANASYYSYDIHGNVDTLLQDFGNSAYMPNAMNQSGNRFKKILYDYDLISGKVNQVSYQPGAADAYYHRYNYDSENRIVEVYSGRDSTMLQLFKEREANYFYYKHGPLARAELGQLRVQGMDYVYTLQGWLKSVNPAMGGTLANGIDTTEPKPISQDVYGYSLNYYKNDYKAIGFTPQANSILGGLTTNAAPLYNGNISAMAVNIPKIGSSKVYNYHYDQLNRVVAMDVFNGLNPTAGTFTPVSTNDYQERVAYDPNGNIRTYQRNSDAARPGMMDNLSYSYSAYTNQLHKVVDAATDVAAGSYPLYNDLKTGQADNNYGYDSIGNLIRDNSEGITAISWTVYGKIASITKSGSVIRYLYDAAGNRIMKQTATDTTVYVRDASGNVLSVYVKKTSGGGMVQTETHLYGSSRLGIASQHMVPDTMMVMQGRFDYAKKSSFTRGEKFFELSNHLGNVLVTISDRRQQVSAGGITVDSYVADVVTAQDYYPFGMLMPGRKYTAGAAGYRYGFNGKENDNEVKGSGNQQDYGMRIYDPRIGKFLSVDPITKQYPELTPYQFASNSPIEAVDLDGLERSPAGKFGQYQEIVRDNTAVQLYSNALPVIQKQKENAPKLRLLNASANRPTATVEDGNKAAFRNNLSNPDNIGGQAAFDIFSNIHYSKVAYQEGDWVKGTMYALNAGITTATLTGAGEALGGKGNLEIKIEPFIKEPLVAPEGWVTKPSQKGGGIVFQDPNNPHNSIRQMPGKTTSPNVAQQNPYIIFMKNGVAYDVNGKSLKSATDPSAHIPSNEFDVSKMPSFK